MVVANNSHDRERLHAVLLGVEERSLVEHDIRMDVGIQVTDTVLGNSVLEGSLSVTRGVIGAVASLVISTITIDIHVIITAI